jgi:hypothetical protein
MKQLAYIVLIMVLNLSAKLSYAQTPPYIIVAYIDSNVIKTNDYSVLQSITYTGQGMRWMFDRRIDDWEQLNAYLFDVVFDDGLTTEVQVNPEFGSSSNAMVEANKYAFIMGQLPNCLRAELDKIWIHQGDESFGGGFNGVLIHTGRSPEYEALGILEEVLFHEATHTALDPFYSSSISWTTAQNSDDNFISTYALSSPSVEDVAESFLSWFMVKHCARRISALDSLTIAQTIPNRLAFFDNLSLGMYPLCINGTVASTTENNQQAINVNPNPIEDKFILDASPYFIGKSYRIHNLLGQCITSGIIEAENTIINVDFLTPGAYLLTVEQGGVEAKTIIKR